LAEILSRASFSTSPNLGSWIPLVALSPTSTGVAAAMTFSATSTSWESASLQDALQKGFAPAVCTWASWMAKEATSAPPKLPEKGGEGSDKG
jgi:hypothetical protein